MFLITPEFTVRTDEIVKIVPRANPEEGTIVILRHDGMCSKEYTHLSYVAVTDRLRIAVS